VTPLRFAVIGDPIAHSKSPVMHAAAYRALGLPHTYEALHVKADDLPRVVQALREGAYEGMNVTVPHKARVLALADEVTADARAIGAGNTLARSGGRVVAHNTDAPALALEIAALRSMVWRGPSPAAGDARDWSGRRGLVLGSGGAARAALAALRDHLGLRDVVIRARSSRDLPAGPLAPSPESEALTAVVVQATSAGMHGADPGDAVASAVAWDALPADAVALDAVYAPPETPFLRAARQRGLRAANGLGMLARQGALAFEIWTSLPAPLDVMRGALAAAC
jgi:shikimate dehydrogenase